MLKEICRTALRKKRLDAGLSQSDTAYKCGISTALYQRIEAGYNKPRKDVEEKLISLFQLPSNYFTDSPFNFNGQ